MSACVRACNVIGPEVWINEKKKLTFNVVLAF